jgi:hypothetical protein
MDFKRFGAIKLSCHRNDQSGLEILKDAKILTPL